MAIYTIGGDDHVWGPEGNLHNASRVVDVPFEAAAKVADLLSRKANPSWDEISKQRFRSAAKESNLRARLKLVKDLLSDMGIETSSGEAILVWGPNRLSNAAINSGNMKTGPCLSTNAAQASCPSGVNNKAGFRCPLYGAGCYAESGRQAMNHTWKLNKQAGVDYSSGEAKVTPDEVAEDEARLLGVIYPLWQALRINNAVRLHVVGDCVTDSSARTLGKAISRFAEGTLSGPGTKPGGGEKNVWNYTHGWRSVPRSAWGSGISVLASCDSVDQLPDAHSHGYACAIVVPDYLQNDMGKYLGGAYDAGNGFKLLPCPYEVREKNDREERIWCTECKLCLRDDFLRANKTAIAFAAHGPKANRIAERLVNLTVEK